MPFRVVRQLRGGASGADVVLLELAGEEVVVKITSDLAWSERARREVAVYTDPSVDLGVRLPELRGWSIDDDRVVLMLTAERDYPRAPDLSRARWLALAGELGRLHRRDRPVPSWLPSRPTPTSERIRAGMERWRALGAGGLVEQAVTVLEDLDRAGARPSGRPPATLIHGDCHVGNLLLDRADRTLWVDWQEVAVGDGTEDLVFLWQRAEFDAASPPRAAMVRAYTEARGLDQDSGLAAALRAAELRLLLTEWPAFLTCASTEQREAMTSRLAAAAAVGEGDGK